jgi:hypothetical protein
MSDRDEEGLWERADCGEYENKLPHPHRPHESPPRKQAGESKARRAARELLEKEFAEQQATYEEERKKYDAESARLEELFKADLAKDNGIVNHPRLKDLYALACEMAMGDDYDEINFGEVVLAYEKLAVLLK